MNDGPGPSATDLLAALDALPSSVAFWDAGLQLRYANHRARTRFGNPPLGTRLAELVHPDAVALSERYISGALAGVPQQVERAMVDSSGRRYNAHLVSHLPNVVDGVVTGYCALAVDITASIAGHERLRRAGVEAALAVERVRVAADLEHRQVASALGDAVRRLDLAVALALDLGPELREVGELVDRAADRLRATLPGSSVAAPLAAVPDARQSRADALASHPTAPEVPGIGVRWPDDLSGSGWSAEQVRATLELLPSAITLWDHELRLVYVNRAGNTRLIGAARVGAHAASILPREIVDEHVAAMRAALAGQTVHLMRSVDGGRHVQLTYLPRLEAGAVIGVLVTSDDVTSWFEAEVALQLARAESAQAAERETIAGMLRELVLQRLGAAALAAEAADAEHDRRARELRSEVAGALAEIDTALTALPDSLTDLLPTLARATSEVASAFGMAVSVESVGPVEHVALDVASQAAEATVELLRAAGADGARQVAVTVAADPGMLRIRVVHSPTTGSAGGDPDHDVTQRVARWGGTCVPVEVGTTRRGVEWSVPSDL